MFDYQARMVQRRWITGTKEPSRTRLSVTAPIRDARQLLAATLPRNVEIRQAIDPDTPMLIADVAELHQLVMNLAANAAHAMKGRGGVLEVRAGPEAARSSRCISLRLSARRRRRVQN